jgi:uncharacterized protein YndB with AHSA1/START domain
MPGITVSIDLDHPRERVWAALADIGTHVDWMADAESITFTSDQREGVGTEFDCLTKFGPVKLNDRMVVTEWSPGVAMGVRHQGIVQGTGRFTLSALSARVTRFTWTEELRFPWYLAGVVGATVSKPVLRAVWRRNLRRFRDQLG